MIKLSTGPRSTIGSKSDCRSWGCEFDSLAHSHTFMEIGHEMISSYSHSPPPPDSRRVDVNHKQQYVHKVLVNHLVELAQEKACSMN